MRRVKRTLLIILAVLLIIVGAGAWYLWPYDTDAVAVQAMQGDAVVKVTESKQGIVFEPAHDPVQTMGILFYPGAKVNPEGYAPMAKDLASAGYRTIIVKMPLNMAILGKDRAKAWMQQYPDQTFVIGGHSLGGAMAARYAAANPKGIRGLFFLAAYADSGAPLSKSKELPVLSIIASNDKVLDWDSYNANRSNLPENTQYMTIEGGNHAQFGDYGVQKGDGQATITPEEQRHKVVKALTDWLSEIGQKK
ncbi:hypothetical protein BVG16_14795 [Paenibacillus selenitireducens]|jgi:hypothetical protein|uniref:Alpha/beta hydrolase fold-5 domain-containing protein n=1 Tax=Paenibacillus selenitireducens TaxID=1324314 RepID=A0A1T2XCR0_9BACL|nr:alpha/beta fold hydrolase [Paenibacillus selenitireducens]OPA77704.1 hypothetical protein BVG16_14795 [Paenibacillus selenitireducens]